MKLWCALTAAALALLSLPASGQTTVHGFALDRYDTSTAEWSPHIRLMCNQDLGSSLSLGCSVTPKGPLPFFSYYNLTWHVPIRGVDSISVGRLFPLFGYEWSQYRPDQVPAMTYSGITAPLSAVQSGVAVSGHAMRLSWYGGRFETDRVFGNEQPGVGHADIHLQVQYAVGPGILMGASQRLGDISVSGAHLVATSHRANLLLETIGGQSLVQVEYRASGRFAAVCREEWLRSGSKTGLAGTYALTSSLELKLLRENNPGETFVQVGTHW